MYVCMYLSISVPFYHNYRPRACVNNHHIMSIITIYTFLNGGLCDELELEILELVGVGVAEAGVVGEGVGWVDGDPGPTAHPRLQLHRIGAQDPDGSPSAGTSHF